MGIGWRSVSEKVYSDHQLPETKPGKGTYILLTICKNSCKNREKDQSLKNSVRKPEQVLILRTILALLIIIPFVLNGKSKRRNQ